MPSRIDEFKAGNGNWYTRSLFYELALADKTGVRFTLKEQDHEGYPSLYRLYMETGDSTEYNFAIQHLGGWSHWVELSSANFFKEYIQAWRKELAIKIKAAALARISEMAKSPDTKVAFAANKYVLENNWVESAQKRKRGAPSKEEVSIEAKKIAEENAQVRSDFERIMQ